MGTLVQQQPVKSKIRNSFGEIIEFDRLDNVAVDAESITGIDIRIFLRRSQYHHWNSSRSLVSTDLLQNLQPIHFRHFKIEQNYLWHFIRISSRKFSVGKNKLQRLCSVF